MFADGGDAGGHARAGFDADEAGLLGEEADGAFGDGTGLGGGGIRKDEKELVPAVADGEVFLADALAEEVADETEEVVSGGVAEGVVEFFEVVEVDHDDGEVFAGALSGPEDVVEFFVEESAVSEAGEGVCPGLVEGAAELARHAGGFGLDSDGEVVLEAVAASPPLVEVHLEAGEGSCEGFEFVGEASGLDWLVGFRGGLTASTTEQHERPDDAVVEVEEAEGEADGGDGGDADEEGPRALGVEGEPVGGLDGQEEGAGVSLGIVGGEGEDGEAEGGGGLGRGELELERLGAIVPAADEFEGAFE